MKISVCSYVVCYLTTKPSCHLVNKHLNFMDIVPYSLENSCSTFDHPGTMKPSSIHTISNICNVRVVEQ